MSPYIVSDHLRYVSLSLSITVLPSVTVYRCLSLSVAVLHCPLPSVAICHCLLLSVTVCCHPSLSITVCHCPSPSVTVRRCLSLSIAVCHCLLLSITVHHHPSSVVIGSSMVMGCRRVVGGCGSSWVVIVAGHQWESGGDVWVLPSCFLVVQVCISHGP